jgi:[ribosomal protein S18]-alanine N-acetyltransferase
MEAVKVRVRRAGIADVSALAKIDAASFPGHSLPVDYYHEAIMFSAVAVLVAVDEAGSALGYVTLFEDQHNEDGLQVGSLATLPVARRRGVATALLTGLMKLAARSTRSRLRLFTSPDNLAARQLYEHLGFKDTGMIEPAPDPVESRIVYEIELLADDASRTDRATLLSDEAAAGISFSNVLIGIGTAAVGLLIANPPPGASVLTLASGLLILVTSIYSTLCYANSHGLLRADPANRAAALVPVLWGNALSEYLGVFLINVLIVGAVWAYSNDAMLTRITYCIVSAGFVAYVASTFSLLSRSITARGVRLVIAASMVTIGVAAVEAIAAAAYLWGYGLGLAYLLICVGLCVVDLRQQHLAILAPGEVRK